MEGGGKLEGGGWLLSRALFWLGSSAIADERKQNEFRIKKGWLTVGG